jgi:hypothetical protein
MENEELPSGAGDSSVTEFATYEEYLDSQITPIDLYYLEVSPNDRASDYSAPSF